MFISNNRASFHLWWKENLVKHQKVSKYYENDCTYFNIGFDNETGSSYSRIIFWAMNISRIYTKLWKELEKFNLYQSWQFRLICKCLNFTEKRKKSSQRKKLKLPMLEYYSLCGKVKFSEIHPTHITIYSFWRTM